MKIKWFTKLNMLTCILGAAGLLVQGETSAQSVITSVISAVDDDMEELNGNIDPGSSDLELVSDGGNQIIGLRFRNVALPGNAVVQSAYIKFGADESNNDPTNLIIRGQASDNPGIFSATDKVSSRQLTNASVSWNNIPAWAANDYTDAQKTPDLKTIIQEITGRAGWVKNNAMVFVISGTGKRVADAFNEGEEDADTKHARLVIEYFVPVKATVKINHKYDDLEEYLPGITSAGKTVGGLDTESSDLELGMEEAGNVDPMMVGLRFASVNVPQNATLLNAYVQFTVDAVSKNTDPSNLVVRAEASDSAATFFPFNNFILTSRPKTSDSVAFVMAPWTTVGDAGVAQRTADIKTLIHAVISRSNWKKGNPVALYIHGSGLKEAESADGNLPQAASLVIEYLGNDSSVVFQKAVYPVGAFPLNKGSVWKYNASGTDLSGENWTTVNYAADTAWAFSKSRFAYGSGAGTVLDTMQGKRNTYYFRNSFKTNPSVISYDSLIFFAEVNDGAVIYLNGVEVKRINMPAGNISYSTNAVSDFRKVTRFVIPNTLVASDTNTIAVELHAFSAAHTNLSFELDVLGKSPAPVVTSFPLKKNSVWSVNDQGTDLGTEWKNAGYNTGNWIHGPGVLGYGDPVATTLWFGEDASNKFPAAYFRKSISISDISGLSDSLNLNMRADDGAAVYVNGTEVLRVNMPAGNISYNTYASKSPVTESEYYSYRIPKSAFVNGNNVIAVEVHQDGASSSDLTFDMELFSYVPPVAASGCNGINDNHISCFTSVPPSSKNDMLNIPLESHTMQVIVQSGYAYNTGSRYASDTLLGNFDFTGYVPENMTSSTKGHLSINHERAMGAVSMLDLHFDSGTKIWMVDSAQGIDFSQVRGTQRNCSGGVTPWGTIITSEETTAAADSNNDGYIDLGWNVEIDPVTNKIPSYGTGKQQKLWQVGRANHENVVVANDSLTLYWGEDASQGNVFKFVADNKADLSSGTLYVLRLNSGLVSDEPTSSEGTWVMVHNKTKEDQNKTTALARNLNATMFNGVEDIEIHPLTGKIYFTAKGNSRTYRFKDNGTTVTEFETFAGGMSYSFVASDGVTYTEPWLEGNDNLVFDDRGNLYVQQDGGKDHIWLVRNDHTQESPKVELFATTPEGSEPTGMTFSPDFRFAFISMQNPSSRNMTEFRDAAGNQYRFNKNTALVIARNGNLANPVVTGLEPQSFAEFFASPSVYPNPSDGVINISFGLNRSATATVEVFTMTGVQVARTAASFDAGLQNTRVKLEPGLYVVKVTTETGTFAEKVIVK